VNHERGGAIVPRKPKVPQPWERKGRGWYVTIGGKQVPLGGTEEEAQKEYLNVLALAQAESLSDQGPLYPLVELFLADAQAKRKPKTYRQYSFFSQSFYNWLKETNRRELRVDQLRPFHIDNWLRSHPTWGPGSQRIGINVIVRALNWAVKKGYVSRNPVKGIERPPARSRGDECVVSNEEHKKLLAVCKKECWRHVLMALRHTGGRPGEVAAVTADNFNEAEALWEFDDHKLAGKGLERVIALTPTLVALSKALAAAHPAGPLFRNSRGNGWTDVTIAKLVRRLRKKAGLGDHVIPYAYRHTFATEQLEKGTPDAHVATLMGHSSTDMLYKHYGHLRKKIRTVRRAVDDIKAVDGETI
jgi:integrase